MCNHLSQTLVKKTVKTSIFKFGGQSTETGRTTNKLEIITGPNNFDGDVKCVSYRAGHHSYKEFKLPPEYSPETDHVQKGDVPSSRMGATIGALGGEYHNFLVCVGGLSIPEPSRYNFHPSDSNIFC